MNKRVALGVGTIGLLLLILVTPATSSARNISPAEQKETRAVSNKVLKFSQAELRTFSRARFNPELIDQVYLEGQCMNRVIERVVPLLEKDPSRALELVFTVLGIAIYDFLYTAAANQQELLSAHQQKMLSRAERWQENSNYRRSKAVAGILRAYQRQARVIQQTSLGIDIDSCQLEDLLTDNDGYQSTSRFFFLFYSWVGEGGIKEGYFTPAQLANYGQIVNREERRIERLKKMMIKALSPKQGEKVRNLTAPAFGLVVALDNQYGRQYPEDEARSYRRELSPANPGSGSIDFLSPTWPGAPKLPEPLVADIADLGK